MKKAMQQGFLILTVCLLQAGLLHAQEEEKTITQAETVQNIPDNTHPSFLNKLLSKYTTDTVEKAKKGVMIKPSITLGVGYRIQNEKEGKTPFGDEHSISLNYALNRGGMFLEYKSIFYQSLGKWNLGIVGRADFPNVVNFFGVGNETQRTLNNNRYYRIRTSELYAGLSINRLVDSSHFFEVRPFFQSVKVKMDDDRIMSDKSIQMALTDFNKDNFAGTELRYQFTRKDNLLMPSRGFDFGLSSTLVMNVNDKRNSFAKFSSFASAYFPILPSLTFAIRAGGTAIQGEPQFYQLATLGGSENLRGYRRQRFYGERSFYNNNELRWLTSTNSKLFSKVGLLGFVDQGRVWQPREKSDTWHVGYGGGIIIVPFNRVVLNGSYGFSKEDNVMHLRVGFFF